MLHISLAELPSAGTQQVLTRQVRPHHRKCHAVLKLIDEHTDGRPLGVLGEKTVNVLDLNLALDASSP